MEHNETTIEELARMINEGFKGTATKEDIKEIKEDMTGITTRLDGIDSRLEGIDARLDHLDARVGRIEADIHDMSGAIVYRHEFDDALARIKYLEKKLGIESGV
jgi:archaellum component FlaC